jgi:hypothetical protein
MLLILLFVFGALAAVTGLWGFLFFAAALAFIARRLFPLFLVAFIVFLVLILV